MFSNLREDIRSIIERDPAARNAWEVLTCYPGLHAVVMHRWAHACWRANFRWFGRFISYFARVLTGIEIHPGATIGRRVFIDHGFGVVIGETAVVGDDCTIYQGVTLGGTTLVAGTKRHPTLERGVIVGAGAQVLGAFTVGEYAKVGSNAVVVKPVPAGATAVGNPAHIVRKEDQTRSAQMFAAYGVTPNGDDPLSKALRNLINHVAQQDEQIERMCATMKAAGIRCHTPDESDKLDQAQLNRLVD
ncbi:serine O-acetyltransferase [Massilia sp. TW-1]|uniref:Serine acetyltransferase n=1 Tax=Telluria antibiotica TaxID=2717319 RepID=A0ABX0PH11_9BURK|nr:serine O-acetyltransferase [Telluria antibiotica]NIA56566.1 serine O-acetyltransferase [Telluria antibiotica]